jgi:hypothetical protein
LYRIATLVLVTIISFLPAGAFGNLITNPEQLAGEGVDFTWPEVQSKSLRIFLEYRDQSGEWQSVNLGSGFLISSDGLFVTAYHVMKYCLAGRENSRGFAVTVDCSPGNRRVRYKAKNGDQEYDIQLVSFLRESDATGGKGVLTPDEIIKRRDFVIGKLKTDKKISFAHWNLREFDESRIDLKNPGADFHLTPLMPPKRVFIIGFPEDDQFVISRGFLNLTEKNGRGYFAADYKLYSANYLRAQGLAPDTRWGMRVENHMSGGAVMDSSGRVIGVVVNGNRNTAGVLSIENVLSTFFSRTTSSELAPSVILNPTSTPLYLKRDSSG